MKLEIGNVSEIDEPSCEQLRHTLRNLPSKAPFMILHGDEELFIQALLLRDVYRVELRRGTDHRYAMVPLEVADAMFDAFRSWNEDAINAFAWRRLRFWNDPYRLFICFAVISLTIAACLIWRA